MYDNKDTLFLKYDIILDILKANGYDPSKLETAVIISDKNLLRKFNMISGIPNNIIKLVLKPQQIALMVEMSIYHIENGKQVVSSFSKKLRN